jgi:signal transduction histidine kinase
MAVFTRAESPAHPRDAADPFATLMHLSPDLVLTYRDRQIVSLNLAAARALGFETVADWGAATGGAVTDILHPDDLGTLEARLAPARTPPTPAEHEHEDDRGERAPGSVRPGPVELRWRRRDGTYCMTEAVAATTVIDGVDTVIVVGRDVTERAEFEQQLVQRDRMAALGTLSAGVAHEINNPLTYLLVNLEHVLRRLRAACASDDPVAELASAPEGLNGLTRSLQHAVEGANRVRQIVRDLLTFAQGNIEQRGLVDVRGIVESATQMAWHEIRHRARLTRSLAELPPVEANEARLGQVFLNLLVNAAQAIPEGHADRHEVRVATRTDDQGRAVVEISDTGVGIAAEHMPRIFDPFFTTKGESGTGLGLAISHGTVKAAGGDIQVTSSPGEGTTFRVILPAAKRWRSAAPASSPEIRALMRRRVLVVDDERLVGEAIARSLSEDNDVEVVTEASHALERIGAGKKYDIVLCDLMMPVMTGMDLYAEIMRTEPKLGGRLIFMTGGAFTPRARAFVESIVNPCLEKPLDMAKLRSLVARAGAGKD